MDAKKECALLHHRWREANKWIPTLGPKKDKTTLWFAPERTHSENEELQAWFDAWRAPRTIRAAFARVGKGRALTPSTLTMMSYAQWVGVSWTLRLTEAERRMVWAQIPKLRVPMWSVATAPSETGSSAVSPRALLAAADKKARRDRSAVHTIADEGLEAFFKKHKIGPILQSKLLTEDRLTTGKMTSSLTVAMFDIMTDKDVTQLARETGLSTTERMVMKAAVKCHQRDKLSARKRKAMERLSKTKHKGTAKQSVGDVSKDKDGSAKKNELDALEESKTEPFMFFHSLKTETAYTHLSGSIQRWKQHMDKRLAVIEHKLEIADDLEITDTTTTTTLTEVLTKLREVHKEEMESVKTDAWQKSWLRGFSDWMEDESDAAYILNPDFVNADMDDSDSDLEVEDSDDATASGGKKGLSYCDFLTTLVGSNFERRRISEQWTAKYSEIKDGLKDMDLKKPDRSLDKYNPPQIKATASYYQKDPPKKPSEVQTVQSLLSEHFGDWSDDVSMASSHSLGHSMSFRKLQGLDEEIICGTPKAGHLSMSSAASLRSRKKAKRHRHVRKGSHTRSVTFGFDFGDTDSLVFGLDSPRDTPRDTPLGDDTPIYDSDATVEYNSPVGGGTTPIWQRTRTLTPTGISTLLEDSSQSLVQAPMHGRSVTLMGVGSMGGRSVISVIEDGGEEEDDDDSEELRKKSRKARRREKKARDKKRLHPPEIEPRNFISGVRGYKYWDSGMTAQLLKPRFANTQQWDDVRALIIDQQVTNNEVMHALIDVKNPLVVVGVVEGMSLAIRKNSFRRERLFNRTTSKWFRRCRYVRNNSYYPGGDNLDESVTTTDDYVYLEKRDGDGAVHVSHMSKSEKRLEETYKLVRERPMANRWTKRYRQLCKEARVPYPDADCTDAQQWEDCPTLRIRVFIDMREEVETSTEEDSAEDSSSSSSSSLSTDSSFGDPDAEDFRGVKVWVGDDEVVELPIPSRWASVCLFVLPEDPDGYAPPIKLEL